MLAFAIVLLVSAWQDTRTETWPNGSKKAEYEVALDADGAAQKHGRFRSFYEDGMLASEGTFEHDKESGAWIFYHPNGAKAAAGKYADALRSGSWQTFYPDGKPESEGGYVRGARDGRWTFWRADGTKDLVASGIHKLVVYRSKEGGRHYRGYLVDNQRQGTWTSYWPDRTPQLEGSYVGGKRVGEWTFRHPDGVVSSLLLTGRYSGGTWASALTVPEPPPFDASRFPPIEPSPVGWPARRDELDAAIVEALRHLSVPPELTSSLAVVGVPAIPIVLERLRAVDPETPQGRTQLGLIEVGLLKPLCAGHTLSRYGQLGPPDAPSARELVRAWLSLWQVTRTDLSFWQSDVPGPLPSEGQRELLQDPPLLELDRRFAPRDESAAEKSAAESGATAASTLRPAYRFRFGRAKEDRLRFAPSGTKETIARGLRWLVAHQKSDGSWDSDNFSAQCGKLGKEKCGGPGGAAHDVGATGLALQALLGDGNTPLRGQHREIVTRALEWLVRQQASEGLIGERNSHDFLYDHAIATAALCEGVGLGGEALRSSAERALTFLQFARNPEAGWRYDVPPEGQSDSSVTGWALQALLAARHADLTVDPAALEGGLAFLTAMTNAESGRIGYSGPDELSSRTSANESFPRELGEAITAEGLLCRLQLGQTPLDTPILLQHAKLLSSKPPEIDELGNDLYYWHFGTCALYEYGPPFWDAWEVTLRKAVIGTQEKRGDAEGSWNPVGPWGYVMGRVCSTALMTLTLECFYRTPRASDGE
jgi:antitoxin component YwqK of YwqJK toxin-antitoxin module